MAPPRRAAAKEKAAAASAAASDDGSSDGEDPPGPPAPTRAAGLSEPLMAQGAAADGQRQRRPGPRGGGGNGGGGDGVFADDGQRQRRQRPRGGGGGNGVFAALLVYASIVTAMLIASEVLLVRWTPPALLELADRSQNLTLVAELRQKVVAARRALNTTAAVARRCEHQATGVRVEAHEVQHVGRAGAACDAGGAAGLAVPPADAGGSGGGSLVAPVVVMSRAGPAALAKTLSSLLRAWEGDPRNARRFPLYVSVDGEGEAAQRSLLLAAALRAGPLPQLQIIRHDNRAPAATAAASSAADGNGGGTVGGGNGSAAAAAAAAAAGGGGCGPSGRCGAHQAAHLKMLLQLFFDCPGRHAAPKHLVLLDDSLEVAPDAFGFYAAAAKLLQRDATLWCASAWNDHGVRGRARDAAALLRTDVLPPMGVMVPRAVARDLWPRLPAGARWADYVQQRGGRRGRQCVHPELPRVRPHAPLPHTSPHAAHVNALLPAALLAGEAEAVDWAALPLDYATQPHYGRRVAAWLRAARPLAAGESLAGACGPPPTSRPRRAQQQQEGGGDSNGEEEERHDFHIEGDDEEHTTVLGGDDDDDDHGGHQHQHRPPQGADAAAGASASGDDDKQQQQEAPPPPPHDLLLPYASSTEYAALVGQLAPMVPSSVAGSPLGSYDGIVVVRCAGERRALLTRASAGKRAAAAAKAASTGCGAASTGCGQQQQQQQQRPGCKSGCSKRAAAAAAGDAKV